VAFFTAIPALKDGVSSNGLFFKVISRSLFFYNVVDGKLKGCGGEYWDMRGRK
jgi:hypothetical protein